MPTTYPLRLDDNDHRLFKQAARSRGLTLADYIRVTVREDALPAKKEPACFKYLDEIEASPEAIKNPKDWIRKQILKKHARNR